MKNDSHTQHPDTPTRSYPTPEMSSTVIFVPPSPNNIVCCHKCFAVLSYDTTRIGIEEWRNPNTSDEVRWGHFFSYTTCFNCLAKVIIAKSPDYNDDSGYGGYRETLAKAWVCRPEVESQDLAVRRAEVAYAKIVKEIEQAKQNLVKLEADLKLAKRQ